MVGAPRGLLQEWAKDHLFENGFKRQPECVAAGEVVCSCDDEIPHRTRDNR